MSDLTEFLLARIAEDEAVARAAMEYADASGSWTMTWSELDRRVDPSPTADMQIDQYTSIEDDFSWAIHANRHDPARVLAQCAAMREVVAALEQPATYASSTGGGRAAREALRALAKPYADHPDYPLED